jgi:(E)-4-hydroxy-3-methylbut-2-enyl-diphosphate synthase
VRKVEKDVKNVATPMTVAIMGCVVNGPGEAREADIGIAGGKGAGVLFKKGKVVRKVREAEFASALLKEIHDVAGKP